MTATPGPEHCDYCDQLATHIYDTEALCRTHQREHGTRYFRTPAETRRARDKATRRTRAPDRATTSKEN
ncbi:hypothetical protein [Parafrankia sp. FMc2]|uniref:hypothetical protein n=1 Tax=Parafrankia sp. FMc2 TaxID=3233196 RepID=UPI0034D71B34